MRTNKLAPLAAVLLFGIAACNDSGNPNGCPATCPTLHSACDPTTSTDGKCICDPGYEQCGSACVSLASDPANCGMCGTVCDATTGYTCINANCICGNDMFGLCPTDGGPDVCSDPTTDNHNCGFCGNDCGQLQCSNGSCTCNSPLYQCTAQVIEDGGVVPDAGTPYCADISNDIDNCGKCGLKCGPSGQTHDARQKAWQCVSTTGGPGICACRTGFLQCQSSPTAQPDCVDTATSTQNCGSCNNVCIGGVCNNSHCDCSAPGYVLCATAPPNDKFACHLPESTVTHCGSSSSGDTCGTDCTTLISGAICDQGNCACTINKDAGTICGLDAGLTPFCTDLSSDPDNCGGCFSGITPPFNTCADGRPSCDVAQGEQLCALPDASFCTNINRGDPAHCGACAGPNSDCNTWNGANSICESSSCKCTADVLVGDGGTDGGPAAYCIVNANQGTCSCNASQACIPEDPTTPLSWGHDIFPLFQTGPGGVTSASKLGCTASGCHSGGETQAAGHLDLSDLDAGYNGLMIGPIFGGKTCSSPPVPATTGAFDCPCVPAALPDKTDPTKSSVLVSIMQSGNFPQKCNTQQVHQDQSNVRLIFSPCAQLIVNDWIDAGAHQ